ncbi:MAG: cohesin domain-containing protein [Patescibacteria group bacterium]|jgi:hypothetical protein
MEKSSKKIYKIILSIAIFIFSAVNAQAATLFLSPASSSYFSDKTFTVGVYVTSSDQSINAVSGIASFPTDKLEVVSISKSGSLFNFWAQEPSFSNSSGKVSFEGVILNPGFKGSYGKLLTISFKAKGIGQAPISFSSASVLANDGLGTNVLSGTGGAEISIKKVVEEEKVGKEEINAEITASLSSSTAAYPVVPKITSKTNPDPEKWYNIDVPYFLWDLPEGVISVSLLIDQNKHSAPLISYMPAIREKAITGLDDGSWYLHIAFKYADGTSTVQHFPFNVDKTAPESLGVSIIADNGNNIGVRSFIIAGVDKESGIADYEITIDNQEPIKWGNYSDNIFQTPLLDSGEHTIKVRVYDKAGNYKEESQKFTVTSIRIPEIDAYPEKIGYNSELTISGRSIPENHVIITFDRQGKYQRNYLVLCDQAGNFTFVLDRLIPGEYSFYARTIDTKGNKSQATSIYNFRAKYFFGMIWPYFTGIFLFLILALLIISGRILLNRKNNRSWAGKETARLLPIIKKKTNKRPKKLV